MPKRTTAMTGFWTSETGARQESTPAYGLDEIQIHEIASYIDVSNWQLEDSAFDMGAELAFDFAEAFGAVEGTAFVNGNGVGKPEGLMRVAGITEVVTGAATSVTADSLRSVLYGLPQFYRQRSSWLMNGTTLGEVAKLKDGNGQYLWTPGLTEAQGDRLLGRPVIEAVDMPDIGSGTFPVVLGDFSRYRIFDRLAVQVLRDPYSQAGSGFVRFHGRRRVGAQLQMTEAFRKLKCSV